MEILFENNYTRNKEWAKDCHGYICFRRPTMIVFQIICILYFIIGILDSIFTKSVCWQYISLALIFYPLIVFVYIRNVNTEIKRDLEIHGKAIEVTLAVTEDIIKQSSSTGAELQLNYNDIKRVVQTKKYIYLLSKTNTIYSFKKDSFSVGSTNEFLLFLKNKGIKVRGRY